MSISRVLLALSLSAALVGCDSGYNYVTPDLAPEVISHPADPPDLWQVDDYVQIQEPEVDVLWVVDNSSSMADEQAAIGEDFPKFYEYFEGSQLDYHIGVVSTDMEHEEQSGKLVEAAGVRWITPDTPNPEDVFAAMSELGTGGSHNEEGILAGYAAFELQPEWNAGFLRANSSINIIVVSDESDVSPNSPITLGEYEEYLNGLRADPEMVSYNGIVSPTEPAFPCEGANSPGDRYIDVINKVGGVFWSRCDEDWPAALELMGLTAAGLKREYFLTQVPVPGTVQVSVENGGYTHVFTEYDPETALGDWTYVGARNSVTFLTYVPEPGATVEIQYKILAANEHED
jgi:hypothetical protein